LKKLLIIQTDSAYFLFETLNVLSQHPSAISQFETTILVDSKSYQAIKCSEFESIKGLVFSESDVINQKFDLSINLSLNELSWDLHGQIKAQNKLGVSRQQGQTLVLDLWSTFFMTIKANVPFLAFHLQDIYKHILGIKKASLPSATDTQFKTIVLGYMNPQHFKAGEQEEFINGLTRRFRFAKIKDVSEVSPVDGKESLYIGPASLDALRFRPARSIILTSQFQGFNLLPKEQGTVVISSRGENFKANQLLDHVEKILQQEKVSDSLYSIYTVDSVNYGNTYIDLSTSGEDHYPFYQVYTVLWNFILGLTEVDLPVSRVHQSQKTLIDSQVKILKKLTRLHEYAMVSLDVILKEAKASSANAEIIEGHLKNLRDMDQTFESIARSHSLLQPVLDFYRIRRGQNDGSSLLEQVQNSILIYHEEHQALQALAELLEKFPLDKSVPLLSK
jgi:hypothetical protein